MNKCLPPSLPTLGNLGEKWATPNDLKAETGFTLVEVIVTVVIVGILAAIATPSFLGLLERQRLASANNQIYQAIRQAQNKAKQERVTWQTSFREQGGVAQWAVHRANVTPSNWNSLDSNVRIDSSNTTFSPWRVQFNYKGNINGQLGKITLTPSQNSQKKRCVIVSTLLGATRTESGSSCN